MRIKRPTASAYVNGKAEKGIDNHALREIIEIGNNQIWPAVQEHLTGREPHIQAAILAHVTSLWLTAYQVQDETVVEPMLVGYLNLVRQLLHLNSQIVAGMIKQ